MKDDDYEKFGDKYVDRIKKEFSGEPSESSQYQTREYLEFKREILPKHMSWYEKACNFSEKIMQVKPDKARIPELKIAIETCHLNSTPTGVASFAIFGPLMLIIVVSLLAYGVPLALGGEGSLFLIFFTILIGVAIMAPLGNLPVYFADNWRMKASNQMVLCIFYIVTYMRHTSNLELAVNFAAEHLGPPLSLDLKKVIWNVEMGRFDSLRESIDAYLETWKKWNMEFVESIHLIESSLFESDEGRRVNALDKSLTVMLDETYERMLHYTHNLQAPLNTLHMLGIILPILGMVILPLAVSFIPEVKWYHLFMIYNITLPIIVYYFSKTILSKRPTGYGNTDIADINPELKKYKNVLINVGGSEIKINPAFLAISIFILLFFVGIIPLVLHSMLPGMDYVILKDGADWVPGVIRGIDHKDAVFYFLGYRNLVENEVITDKEFGPFGLGATLISLCIPLALGISVGLFYKIRSSKLIGIRNEAKKLEKEFGSALFQLGNRLGDGIPAEMAFDKVARVMEGTTSGKFFDSVSINITKLGMSVEQAIFDEKVGAIKYFPSNVIESSMKVLIESSKKGPLIASQALINVSEYIKQMHRVEERLKDLMADIISSMKSQVSFLTPAITGIVIGITSMISVILGKLGGQISSLTGGGETGGVVPSGAAALLGAMGSGGVPTYYFQIIVGLYVVQIVFLLTILINGIENGADSLTEKFLLGRNMNRTTLTYVITAFCIILLFNIIAGTIISQVIGQM